MIDSRTGEIIEFNEHTDFYHWRLGSMHFHKPVIIDSYDSLNNHIELSVDNTSSIVNVINENMNEFLAREPKTFSIYSLGVWLFFTIEEMGENVLTRHWNGLLTGSIKKCWKDYEENVCKKEEIKKTLYIELYIEKYISGSYLSIKSQAEHLKNDFEIIELSKISYFKDNLANFTNHLEFIHEFPQINKDNLIFYAKALETLNIYRIEMLKKHFHKDDDGLFNIRLLNKSFNINDENFKKSKQVIIKKCEDLVNKMEKDFNSRTKIVTDKLLSRMKDNGKRY